MGKTPNKKPKKLTGVIHGGTGHLPAEVRQAKREERERLRKLSEEQQDD